MICSLLILPHLSLQLLTLVLATQLHSQSCTKLTHIVLLLLSSNQSVWKSEGRKGGVGGGVDLA